MRTGLVLLLVLVAAQMLAGCEAKKALVGSSPQVGSGSSSKGKPVAANGSSPVNDTNYATSSSTGVVGNAPATDPIESIFDHAVQDLISNK